MKPIKIIFVLTLFFSCSNNLVAQTGLYHPSGAGNFFTCDLQQDGTIKLTMSMPSSARNMCEDFEGEMKKDAKGNFICYLMEDGDRTNMIIGVIKSKNDLINGVPKKIEVRTTSFTSCDVPKGIYTFGELGD